MNQAEKGDRIKKKGVGADRGPWQRGKPGTMQMPFVGKKKRTEHRCGNRIGGDITGAGGRVKKRYSNKGN